MDPYKIIDKYYSSDRQLYNIYTTHVEQVKNKALDFARTLSHLNPDMKFISEASLLHDIGIFKTDTPSIRCYGSAPYIAHMYLGREILESEGLPKHALVCERHTGPGLTKEDVIKENLPLPIKDYLPITVEEKIICLADNFFRKVSGKLEVENSWKEALNLQRRFGEHYVDRLQALAHDLGVSF